MQVKSEIDSQRIIKIGIWIYFFLLLFEGALRKWFLPMLAGPIVLIRDPLVLFLLYKAFSTGLLKANIYITIMTFVSLIAIGTTLIIGHGHIGVCLYGARIILLYFPMIFVIGKILNREDILKMGRILVYITIPMTALMILQFYSPQTAWVNRGLAGDIEGAGFSGALGFYRPPGIFSFISGLVQFYGITACFIFYFWLKPHLINRTILIVATICLFIAIPYSISRTLFYQTAISLLFLIFAVAQKPKNLPKIFFGIITFISLLAFLANTNLENTPLEPFTARFQGATKYEGGVSGTLVDRFIGGMFEAISNDLTNQFFGKGLGSGTNAGAQILPLRQGGMVWHEEEWQRIVSESGILLGLTIIILRVILGLHLTIYAYSQLTKHNSLPWLILSFTILLLVNGQWGQPTTLGFSILVSGLLIAVLNHKETN